MASEKEASCQSCLSDPNFAIICSFLERFAKSCGIIHPTFAELQEMLEDTQELSHVLIDIHIKLLRKCRKSIVAEKWEKSLFKFVHSYSNQDGWELERFGYKRASVGIKLRLLKALLEEQFDKNVKFKNEVNKLAADELRSEPLGRDKSGLAYWAQFDPVSNVRVYREDLDDESWQLIAKDRDSLVGLITQLSSAEDLAAMESLLNEDSNSLEIEKPITDTGQVEEELSEYLETDDGTSRDDSSSSNCDKSAAFIVHPPDLSTDAPISQPENLIAKKEQPMQDPAETNSFTAIENARSRFSEKENSVIVGDKKEPSIFPADKVNTPIKLADQSDVPLNDLSFKVGQGNMSSTNFDFKPSAQKTQLEMDLSIKTQHEPGIDVTEEIKLRGALLKPNPVGFKGTANGKGSKLDKIFKLKHEQNITVLNEPPPESQPLRANIGPNIQRHLPTDALTQNHLQIIEKLKKNFAVSLSAVCSDKAPQDLTVTSAVKRVSGNLNVHHYEKKICLDGEIEVGEAIEEPMMLVKGEGSGKQCDTGNPERNSDNAGRSEAVEKQSTVTKEEKKGDSTHDEDCTDSVEGNVVKSSSVKMKTDVELSLNLSNEVETSFQELFCENSIRSNYQKEVPSIVGDIKNNDCLDRKSISIDSENKAFPISLCTDQRNSSSQKKAKIVSPDKVIPKLWSIDTICNPDKASETSNKNSGNIDKVALASGVSGVDNCGISIGASASGVSSVDNGRIGIRVSASGVSSADNGGINIEASASVDSSVDSGGISIEEGSSDAQSLLIGCNIAMQSKSNLKCTGATPEPSALDSSSNDITAKTCFSKHDNSSRGTAGFFFGPGCLQTNKSIDEGENKSVSTNSGDAGVVCSTGCPTLSENTSNSDFVMVLSSNIGTDGSCDWQRNKTQHSADDCKGDYETSLGSSIKSVACNSDEEARINEKAQNLSALPGCKSCNEVSKTTLFVSEKQSGPQELVKDPDKSMNLIVVEENSNQDDSPQQKTVCENLAKPQNNNGSSTVDDSVEGVVLNIANKSKMHNSETATAVPDEMSKQSKTQMCSAENRSVHKESTGSSIQNRETEDVQTVLLSDGVNSKLKMANSIKECDINSDSLKGSISVTCSKLKNGGCVKIAKQSLVVQCEQGLDAFKNNYFDRHCNVSDNSVILLEETTPNSVSLNENISKPCCAAEDSFTSVGKEAVRCSATQNTSVSDSKQMLVAEKQRSPNCDSLALCTNKTIESSNEEKHSISKSINKITETSIRQQALSTELQTKPLTQPVAEACRKAQSQFISETQSKAVIKTKTEAQAILEIFPKDPLRTKGETPVPKAELQPDAGTSAQVETQLDIGAQPKMGTQSKAEKHPVAELLPTEETQAHVETKPKAEALRNMETPAAAETLKKTELESEKSQPNLKLHCKTKSLLEAKPQPSTENQHEEDTKQDGEIKSKAKLQCKAETQFKAKSRPNMQALLQAGSQRNAKFQSKSKSETDAESIQDISDFIRNTSNTVGNLEFSNKSIQISELNQTDKLSKINDQSHEEKISAERKESKINFVSNKLKNEQNTQIISSTEGIVIGEEESRMDANCDSGNIFGVEVDKNKIINDLSATTENTPESRNKSTDLCKENFSKTASNTSKLNEEPNLSRATPELESSSEQTNPPGLITLKSVSEILKPSSLVHADSSNSETLPLKSGSLKLKSPSEISKPNVPFDESVKSNFEINESPLKVPIEHYLDKNTLIGKITILETEVEPLKCLTKPALISHKITAKTDEDSVPIIPSELPDEDKTSAPMEVVPVKIRKVAAKKSAIVNENIPLKDVTRKVELVGTRKKVAAKTTVQTRMPSTRRCSLRSSELLRTMKDHSKQSEMAQLTGEQVDEVREKEVLISNTEPVDSSLTANSSGNATGNGNDDLALAGEEIQPPLETEAKPDTQIKKKDSDEVNNKNDSSNKHRSLTLANFSMEEPEEEFPRTRGWALKRVNAERRRTTSKRLAKRETDEESEKITDEADAKRRKTRGKRPADKEMRKSVENKRHNKDVVSSSDESEAVPKSFACAFSNFVTKKSAKEAERLKSDRGRGRPRGRGRGRPRGRSIRVETPDSDSRQSEEDTPASTPAKKSSACPVKKTPVKRGSNLVLGLEARAVEELVKREACSDGGRSMRQSRRIAQIKIKEQAERRQIEEATLLSLQEEERERKKHSRQMQHKVEKKQEKSPKKVKKVKKTDEDFHVSQDETEAAPKVKRKKKKRHRDPAKMFNSRNPWKSSSGSSTSEEEEEEEHFEEEEEEEEIDGPLKSDHEFSPESDLEGDSTAVQPSRRARTALKGEQTTVEAADDTACQKCHKSDHPEWILLCDKCDQGWHASCLRPALMLVPEGDWFCPPCQHVGLVVRLQDALKQFDRDRKRRDNEELRRKRLAYVGISLDNVLPSSHRGGGGGGTSTGESGSESEGSEQSGNSEEDSEPVYQLRQRRHALFSYRFNEYDDLINSAIQDELEAVKGTAMKSNAGRGKDIANIVSAGKDEKQKKDECGENASDAKENSEKTMPSESEVAKREEKEIKKSDAEDDEKEKEDSEEEGFIPRVIPPGNNTLPRSGRKKHRKLNSLDDVSSDDENGSDEDFKGTSTEEEEEEEEDDAESDDSNEVGRGRTRPKRAHQEPTRWSTRTRVSRFDRQFINDGSDESDAPKRKKTRRVWQESDSEESDFAWGRRKKKKNLSPSKSRSKHKNKMKKKKPQKVLDDSDAEDVKKPKPKRPKIKYGLDEPSDDLPSRRTRGRKMNYQEVVGSETEEEIFNPKSKKLPSEDEEEFDVNKEKLEVKEKGSGQDSDDDLAEEKDKIVEVCANKELVVQEQEEKTQPVEDTPIPPVKSVSKKSTKPKPPRSRKRNGSTPKVKSGGGGGDAGEHVKELTKAKSKKTIQTRQLNIKPVPEPPNTVKPILKEVEPEPLKLPVNPVTPVVSGGKPMQFEHMRLATIRHCQGNESEEEDEEEEEDLEEEDGEDEVVEGWNEGEEKFEDVENLEEGEIPLRLSFELQKADERRKKREAKMVAKLQRHVLKESADKEETVVPPTQEPRPEGIRLVSPLKLMARAPGPLHQQMTAGPGFLGQGMPPPSNLAPLSMLMGPMGLGENCSPPKRKGRGRGKKQLAQERAAQEQVGVGMDQQMSPSIIRGMLQTPQQGYYSSRPGDSQFPRMGVPGQVYRPSPPQFPPTPAQRLRQPPQPAGPNQPLYHSPHHPMDPSPSGGGIKGDPVSGPPPPASAGPHARQGPPPLPPPNLNMPARHPLPFPPRIQRPNYFPPPPLNYQYNPASFPSEEALPPPPYQGSPYPEHFADTAPNASDTSNSKSYDEETSGEFGGLVSYFSSQREDDLDT